MTLIQKLIFNRESELLVPEKNQNTNSKGATMNGGRSVSRISKERFRADGTLFQTYLLLVLILKELWHHACRNAP